MDIGEVIEQGTRPLPEYAPPQTAPVQPEPAKERETVPVEIER